MVTLIYHATSMMSIIVHNHQMKWNTGSWDWLAENNNNNHDTIDKQGTHSTKLVIKTTN